MKKRISNRQLGRDHNARIALFKGLVSSLIEHEEIITTSAKARAVRSIFEKLITKARQDSLHIKRQLQSVLQDKKLVKKLVSDIAPRFQKTQGGYTKLVIVGNRTGDNATMVKLSLTKKSSVFTSGEATKKSKKSGKPSTEKKTLSQIITPKVSKPTHESVVKSGKSVIGTKRGER